MNLEELKKEELREKLAELAHEQWSGWAVHKGEIDDLLTHLNKK